MGFILCTENPPKMYKIEFALKSENNCFNGWLRKMVFPSGNNIGSYSLR
jgi:hypothetical protein